MCKNVKQNVLFEQSEFTFCSFCMCKSRPETKSEDEAPKQNRCAMFSQFNDYSGTLIFLLRLGIINAGHSIRFAHDFAPARQ